MLHVCIPYLLHCDGKYMWQQKLWKKMCVLRPLKSLINVCMYVNFFWVHKLHCKDFYSNILGDILDTSEISITLFFLFGSKVSLLL